MATNLLFAFVVYIFFIRLLSQRKSLTTDLCLAFLNLIFFACFLLENSFNTKIFLKEIGVSALFLLSSYHLLHFREKDKNIFWISLSLPLIWLICAKAWGWGALFGISYISFRISYLAVEVYKRRLPVPNLAEFIGFALFIPTAAMGPISSYSNYLESRKLPLRLKNTWPWACFRLFVGATKFVFLASLFETLTFNRFIFNGYRHGIFDLLIACIAFYFMLYCRFSGFCDMMVGAAALGGFRLQENFNEPLLSRNLQEFWNRWHITLMNYMREVIFIPLMQWMIRGKRRAYIWIFAPLCTFLIFILVGIWHGATLNYVLFGLYHAFGLSCVYWYGLYTKTFKKGHLPYFFSWALTFMYISISYLFAANSWPKIEEIFTQILVWKW